MAVAGDCWLISVQKQSDPIQVQVKVSGQNSVPARKPLPHNPFPSKCDLPLPIVEFITALCIFVTNHSGFFFTPDGLRAGTAYPLLLYVFRSTHTPPTLFVPDDSPSGSNLIALPLSATSVPKFSTLQ
jgi:hypothetical protein